ncbi:MAG TPA: hypothetical protein VHO06_21065 [Polyangia bacterium]|nr:hypothetical protein [Polyangia bacterium]
MANLKTKKTTPGERAIEALNRAADAAVRKAPTGLEVRLAYMERVVEIREEFERLEDEVWGRARAAETEGSA